MSGINGDKSRFNRVRKQNIARRMRNRKLLKNMAAPAQPASAPARSAPKVVVA